MLPGLDAKPLQRAINSLLTPLRAAYASAIGSTLIGWLPPETEALLSTLDAELRLTAVRPERFMTNAQKWIAYLRTGAEDFTAQVQKALNTGRPVELTGLYPCGPLTGSDTRIFGKGTLRGTAATAGAALLMLTNCYASDFRVESAPGVTVLYGVLAQAGNRFLAERLTFAGDYGHCIIASGAKNVQILANRVLEGGTHTAPIVISQCENFTVANNVIEEHTGFGIQMRFSGVGTVTGNTIRQRYFQQNFTASATTQTFTVSPDRTCSRFSVFCNGAFHPVTSAVLVAGPAVYNITASGLTPGQPVAIYSFVGLECIQVNSGCYDITATGNSVGSSGDSGMLIGADYHNTAAPGSPANWVLDPNAVTEADYPVLVVFTGNAIRGPTLAAGIAINNGTDCMALGNQISNVGYTYIEAYKVGVSLGLVLGGVYKDNNVDGTNGHTLGALKFVGGQDLRRPPTIGRNHGIGCKGFEAFPARSTLERSFGYDIEGARIDPLITDALNVMKASSWVSGAYSGNNLSIGIFGGAGLTKDSSVVNGSFAALRTTAGQYMDIGPAAGAIALFRNKLVRVSFFGKADNAGDSGYAQLYYQFPGDDASPPDTQLVVNTGTWQFYSMTMALGDITTLFLRIGGNTGAVRIDALRFDMLDLEG